MQDLILKIEIGSAGGLRSYSAVQSRKHMIGILEFCSLRSARWRRSGTARRAVPTKHCVRLTSVLVVIRSFTPLEVAFLMAFGSTQLTAAPALKPWSTNTHPSDVSKSHVEGITAGPHRYTIVQGGTMDGRNCRSPMGCGINREGAYVQT
ncbi:MAG: hypothetical protein HY735_10665 [Verrucomicrobia bacterium]|nr:hypothetical protein [Verrucomicrobiota bacterium]